MGRSQRRQVLIGGGTRAGTECVGPNPFGIIGIPERPIDGAMPGTRWPRVEATILRHLDRRTARAATAEQVAAATGLPASEVTYALEALYEAGRVETTLDGDVRRWSLPDDGGDGDA